MYTYIGTITNNNANYTVYNGMRIDLTILIHPIHAYLDKIVFPILFWF